MSDSPVTFKLRCIGGAKVAPAKIAPRVSPLGMGPNQVIEKITKSTADYKGLPVIVEISILNRQAEIKVIPSASMLILKALDEPLRNRKEEKNIKHDGNITMEQLYEIARVVREKSLAKQFSGTVKEVLGTCLSLGCRVENESPRDITKRIKKGDIVCPEK
ncbi:ribosomal protein L12, L11 [Bonamia ostreae]|uniref:Ribosomal protein L12, L11 n=1 Tax=Bonamia ostreae TaxID=126728 RepID=A0ABV2AJQ6_9EUKA